jgi:DNA-binding beta-propeller fold protein YncE
MARNGSKTLLYSDVCYWLVLLYIAMIAMSACGGGGSTLHTGEVGGGGSGGGGSTGGGGTGGGTGSGAFTAGRTKYVRTDAATEYYGWINSHWIIYNAVTNRFYVADPSANRVIVMDAASESEVAVINVPGAYSIDDTPDHKMLYVASATGDVYVVDPIALVLLPAIWRRRLAPLDTPPVPL